MPGSSLWLLPPASHPLDSVSTSLIRKTSAHFKSPHLFIPHVTLTSEIDPATYSPDPQAWLDKVPFPAGKDIHVKLGRLESQDVFFKKLYSRVGKSGVRDIGMVARTKVKGLGEDDVAGRWADEEYMPHLSLLYHDCPKVDDEGLAEVEQFAKDAGVNLDGEGELGGWVGGRVVLVPTDKPIREWVPIAERTL